MRKHEGKIINHYLLREVLSVLITITSGVLLVSIPHDHDLKDFKDFLINDF